MAGFGVLPGPGTGDPSIALRAGSGAPRVGGHANVTKNNRGFPFDLAQGRLSTARFTSAQDASLEKRAWCGVMRIAAAGCGRGLRCAHG